MSFFYIEMKILSHELLSNFLHFIENLDRLFYGISKSKMKEGTLSTLMCFFIRGIIHIN